MKVDNNEYDKMDDDDFYFANYLKDMLIPFTFGDYGVVGKKELYMYLSGSDKLIKRFPGRGLFPRRGHRGNRVPPKRFAVVGKTTKNSLTMIAQTTKNPRRRNVFWLF